MITQPKQQYDVIVIGGGHAGTEACLAADRMGARTLLLTHNIETIGQMSCNPAIGGIGKSQLVREIDALGGIMAIAADRAAIQLRTLNARKGPAVRALRAQTDRSLYKAAVRELLELHSKVRIVQQSVNDLIIEQDRVSGVITEIGVRFYAPTVILTTGTFLGGTIHIGLKNHSGGRAGDPASIRLADRLRELPLSTGRLKTGTPPRIDSRTVDFSQLQEQWGDSPLPVMSYIGTPEQHPRQLCCWITHTNEQTHDIIRSELGRSPLYTGVIESVGPRYCPSIEDKIIRFADKSSHQIFVEPEGLNCNELYPNGISTSLPYDTQENLVRSIKGFENAHIIRPGYAIEYDFFDPRGLNSNLENRHIKGLFFGGQINGTTGYEEAAAQGLLAGLNAALYVQGKEPWIPRRDQAYMGVLVDDLITKGAPEPYRMFTSRAEYRLLLREDNADSRLTEIGRGLGLVDDNRWHSFCHKRTIINSETHHFKTTFIQPDSEEAKSLESWLPEPLNQHHSLWELIKRPELNYEILSSITGHQCPHKNAALQVEIVAKYSGYIDRQQKDINRSKEQEGVKIPKNFDFNLITSLSNEAKQQLCAVRPTSIGQAGRIPGVTPAAISLLLVYLKKHSSKLPFARIS